MRFQETRFKLLVVQDAISIEQRTLNTPNAELRNKSSKPPQKSLKIKFSAEIELRSEQATQETTDSGRLSSNNGVGFRTGRKGFRDSGGGYIGGQQHSRTQN